MVAGSTSEVTYPQVQKGLARLLRQLDESGLSKLVVEIALLGTLESASQENMLIAASKRLRVDMASVRKTVEAEFATRQAKQAAKQKQAVKKNSARDSKAA